MPSENVKNRIHDGVFLNCDGHRVYFKESNKTAVLPVNKFHSPYCLVICDDNMNPGKYRDTTHGVIGKIEEKIQEAFENRFEDKDNPYLFIMTNDDGSIKYTNPRVWRSFHNPNLRYRCIEVHTTKSYKVPALSTQLFKDFGYSTAEFDIPYRDRAMIDLQAEQRLWLLDTDGEVCELTVLAYDIETTEYDPTEKQDNGYSPIDMIGWASFTIKYKAKRNPDTGQCEFEMLSMPEWEEPEIKQVVGHNLEEEIANLVMFIDLVLAHDIIAGHNIMKFDNLQIHNRLQFLRGYRWNEKRWVPEEGATNHIPDEYKDKVKFFLEKRNRAENIFFYGAMERCVDFFPLSFDTFFASKRLFFFLSEYNLKSLAKTFGYKIEDRVYLDPISQSIETPEKEKKTLKYNEHDVREQIAVTLHLLSDAMRLCHLTGMAFNDCMPAGTTKIWDTMTFIRSHQTKRIMPAIASAQVVCRELFHRFGTVNPKTKKPYTKAEVVELARRSLSMPEPIGQRTLKVLKYGIEAPDYVMYPQLIYNPYSSVMLHVITSKSCGCKECRTYVDIKHCDCNYCQGLRRAYPDGLTEKDEQTGFILSQLKKLGHPEDDEDLMRSILSDRGHRNVAQGYHFPGGLTIHPSEVNSEFKMWWGIKVCDVGCLHEDTDILTIDGYKRIADVCIGDQVLSDIGWQNVIDVRFEEARTLKKIRIESGQEITSTSEHRFPVVNYRRNNSGGIIGQEYNIIIKRADELLIGDRLVDIIDYNIPDVKKDEKFVSVSELIGIFDAEGSMRDEIRDRKRYDRGGYIQRGIRYTNMVFSISTDEPEFEKRITDLMYICFPEFEGFNRQVKRDTKSLSLQAGKSAILDRFKDWYGNKDRILANIDYCRAYLKGFFSGDGYKNIGRGGVPSLVQGTQKKDRLLFASKCLKRCGICHSISVVRKHFKQGKMTTDLVIEIMKWHHQKFLDDIGFVHDYKYYDVEGYGKTGCDKPRNVRDGFKCCRVTDIDDIEGGNVVDITVENQEHPYYYANNILTHNSMYPSNLKAENIGGDTVRFADPRYFTLVGDKVQPKPNSPFKFANEVYKWIWLKRLRYDVFKNFFIGVTAKELHSRPEYAQLAKDYSFATYGYLVAVVIDHEEGGIGVGMGAVLDVTSRIKKQKAEIERADSGASDRLKTQIANAYQSMKSMRNSGSVDSSRKIRLISPDGTVINERISKFYNRFKVKPVKKEIYGIMFNVKKIEKYGWKGFTVSDNGLVQIKPIINAIRHKYDGEMVYIRTVSGYDTLVTPNHSIYTMSAFGGKFSKIEYCLPEECERAVVINECNERKWDIVDDIVRIKPTAKHVYDLEMKDNHNFVDSSGMLVSNTHGILTAPTVSCRQFNLGGGARITTLGQQILDDAMEMLRQINVRFVYGDSVTGDRPVWLRGRDGCVRCLSIKDAFEWIKDYCDGVFSVNPNNRNEYVHVDGVDTLTFDDDRNVIWKPIKYLTRHSFSGDIVRISTAQGDTTVTGQHSIFGDVNGDIIEVKADKLQVGDNVVVADYNFSLPEKDIIINLLEPRIDGYQRLNLIVNIPYIQGKNDELLKHYKFGHRMKDSNKKDRIKTLISNKTVKTIRLSLVTAKVLFEHGLIDMDDLKNGYISSYNGKGKIPVLIPFDEGFATILGFFLTEGSTLIRDRNGYCTTDVVLINNQNRSWCHDVASHVEDIFGEHPAINICDKRSNVYRVAFNNKSIYYLLIHVLGCGKKAPNKHVPMEVLNSKLSVKRAFFDATMNGDGSVAKDSRYIVSPESFTSQSYQMQAVVTALGVRFFEKIPYIKYRLFNNSYTTVFVRKRKYGYKKNDLWTLPVGKVSRKTTSCKVYDICIGDDTPRFFDGLGMFGLHNTDGIYLATARDASAVVDERQTDRHPFREMYDLPDAEHFMDPDLIDQTVAHINKKWQDILDYPTYELEVENEDGMLFVKHKNYLKFHHKFTDDGECKLVFKTKGNNFKAKDKAKIATDAMEGIMREVVAGHLSWVDEEEEFQSVRSDIKNKARTVVDGLNPDEMGLGNFLIRQVIKPVGVYKQSDKACVKCEGVRGGCEYCANTGLTLNASAKRSNALERLIEKPIKSPMVAQCVVCENPLPLLEGRTKSGSKPIAFMWPVDLLEEPEIKEKSGGIDFGWYKDTVFNYIKGAFAFDDWNLKPWVCTMKQMRLDGACTVKIVTGVNFLKNGKKATGKMIDCNKDLFDRLKADEPIPDDIMDELTNLHPDLLEIAKAEGWGEGFDDEEEE